MMFDLNTVAHLAVTFSFVIGLALTVSSFRIISS